jgi:DNA-binding NarL/FixJ family response regulator
MIHILIADPDPTTRKALGNLLKLKLGITDIEEASDLETLIQALAARPPQVLLLDWRLQGSPAPETSRLLQKAYTDLTIVLLSVDAQDAEAARCAGAQFIHKGASPEELINTLKPLLTETETKEEAT